MTELMSRDRRMIGREGGRGKEYYVTWRCPSPSLLHVAISNFGKYTSEERNKITRGKCGWFSTDFQRLFYTFFCCFQWENKWFLNFIFSIKKCISSYQLHLIWSIRLHLRMNIVRRSENCKMKLWWDDIKTFTTLFDFMISV